METCHARLTYARSRIVVQGQFLAMFFVGQFAIGDAKSIRAPSHLATLAKDCGIAPQELTSAASAIRVLDRKPAERLLKLLQLVADTFSHIGEERHDLLTRLKRVAEIAGVPAS